MTAAELQTLNQLGERFKDFREDNKDGHLEIKKLIEGVEERLTAKLAEKDDSIRSIAVHCKEREVQVDAALARQLVTSDAHIAAAVLAAVAEIKKPSVYEQATKGALQGLGRFTAKAAVVAALLAALATIAKALGLL